MAKCQVAVVGSGFAGTILARILHRMGVEVVLIERFRHPRFAIGESSTPLGAICLERLARDYDLPDLAWLAAYGRWMENMPEVRRGLKRGFTFYGHQTGQVFEDDPEHSHRLLVAASPDDAVADSHWLREDVDQHLVNKALGEGVEFWDETEIRSVRAEADGGWTLSGTTEEASFELRADFIVDGSGAGRLLAESLPIASALEEVNLDTSLVFGHFKGVAPLPGMSPGPYPDDRAAVHHLLQEGWLYVLPFDHGVVSAGVVLRREASWEFSEQGLVGAEAIWQEVLSRYPTLMHQFENSVPTRPVAWVPRVQRRLVQAAGRRWAALPHTYSFLDPMFSTGIAWSLLAVERLAEIFATNPEAPVGDITEGLSRYGLQLEAEARQMSLLLNGAYLAMADFNLFVSQSFLYFSTVSFEEVLQRIHPVGVAESPPAWRGFLGTGDDLLETLFADSKRRLEGLVGDGTSRPTASQCHEFFHWVADSIAPRNIAGLGEPAYKNLYPVDLDLLVARADLLGLTAEEMTDHLPRLRGAGV